MKNKRPFTVVVEGNIGSGKTTFLKFYEDLMGTEVYLEPVDKWKNLDGINLLDLMYKEPSRHSFTFQSYVQLTMTEVSIKLLKSTYDSVQVLLSDPQCPDFKVRQDDGAQPLECSACVCRKSGEEREHGLFRVRRPVVMVLHCDEYFIT